MDGNTNNKHDQEKSNKCFVHGVEMDMDEMITKNCLTFDTMYSDLFKEFYNLKQEEEKRLY